MQPNRYSRLAEVKAFICKPSTNMAGSPAGGLKQILQRHSFILRRLPPKDFRHDHRRSPDVLG
jgi:hypothetical protein